MSLSQGFAREIKSEVTMGKNQPNPGIRLEATEENSREKAQKAQKKDHEWARMNTNKKRQPQMHADLHR